MILIRAGGGIAEYAIYDLHRNAWRYGHSNIAMVLFAKRTANGKITTGLSGKAILYDPEIGSSGYVCSMDHARVNWWRLYDVLQPDIIDPPFAAVWMSWKPKTATIRMLLLDSAEAPRSACRSLDWNEMSELIFEINNDGITCGLQQDLFEKISVQFCRLWNSEYDPYYTL